MSKFIYPYSLYKAVYNETTQGAFWKVGQEWKRLVKHIKKAINGNTGTVTRLADDFVRKIKSEASKK